MTRRVGRNDLCPCGSGRKHKNCCAGKNRFAMGPWISGIRLWLILAVGAGAVATVVLSRAGQKGSQAPPPAPASAIAPGEAPAPWAYDSVGNRHYDPNHRHWHQGPPPTASQGGLAAPGSTPTSDPQGAPGSTPAPWTYDAARNQHWDPTHGHWHQGPPPPGAR